MNVHVYRNKIMLVNRSYGARKQSLSFNERMIYILD
jgi:hypothetical protein